MVDRFDELWQARQKVKEQETLTKMRKELSKEEVHNAQLDDPDCKEILRALEGKPVSQAVKNDADQCVIVDGNLYHKDNRRYSIDGQLQLIIPKQFRRDLLKEIHGLQHGPELLLLHFLLVLWLRISSMILLLFL